MKLPFGSAKVEAFVHATEDEQKVLQALSALLPPGAEVKRSSLRGHYGNPISMLRSSLKGSKLLQGLWTRLMEGLAPQEIQKLKLSIPKLIDEGCRFYLRFDKQKAFKGELILTEGSDALHLVLKVLTFPPEQERAIRAVEELIERGKAKAKVCGV